MIPLPLSITEPGDLLVGAGLAIVLLACYLLGMWRAWKGDEAKERKKWPTAKQIEQIGREERQRLEDELDPLAALKRRRAQARDQPWQKRGPEAPRKVL